MTLLIDPMEVFQYNIKKAKWVRELLVTLEKGPELARNVVDSLVNVFPGMKPLVEGLSPHVKDPIDSYLNELKSTLLELSIVSCVTALETYLRDRYCIETESSEDEAPSFQKIDNIRMALEKFDCIELLDDNVERKLKSLLQARHLIIHQAGRIDEKACLRAGWSTKLIGKNIRSSINYKNTGEYLQLIEKLVDEIEKKVIGNAGPL